LQPVELCWLRWCDLNFAEKTLLVTRNRPKRLTTKQQIIVNLLLCPPEIDRLQQQLYQGGPLTGYSPQKNVSQNARYITSFKTRVRLPNCHLHPYMLRRSGLYYRSALLQKLGYLYANLAYFGIGLKLQLSSLTRRARVFEDLPNPRWSFLAALKQLKTFTGIQGYESHWLLWAVTLCFPIYKHSCWLLAGSLWLVYLNFAENIQLDSWLISKEIALLYRQELLQLQTLHLRFLDSPRDRIWQ